MRRAFFLAASLLACTRDGWTYQPFADASPDAEADRPATEVGLDAPPPDRDDALDGPSTPDAPTDRVVPSAAPPAGPALVRGALRTAPALRSARYLVEGELSSSPTQCTTRYCVTGRLAP